MAQPVNACDPIRPRPSSDGTFLSDSTSSHRLSDLPFIVLIERGGCDFDLKVINAQKANFSGVIVYNTVPNEIFPMGGGSCEFYFLTYVCKRPSVFLHEWLDYSVFPKFVTLVSFSLIIIMSLDTPSLPTTPQVN